jgi:predicted hotdog family 3-hydroxylacyl-ACP dehydratase
MAHDGTANTYLRSSNALSINNAPAITITDDVSAAPGTSDTFAFTASDVDAGDSVSTGYALTSATCDASLSFTTGNSVTISDDTTNGQYICAMANDGTASAYLRSTNALNINNLPVITITDDVSAAPVTSDTFTFSIADVDSGDTPVSGYALTSAACDASLSFTAGNGVTISDDTTNGQYICAMANDGTANTYLLSSNTQNID